MPRHYKIQQRNYFRTPVRIKIPAEYPDSLFEELFRELQRVDRKFNSNLAGSVTSQINQQAGSFVEADAETIYLFRNVIYWSHATAGGFDITITPLLRLWGFYSSVDQPKPTSKEIEQALSTVNYKQIEIEPARIRIVKGQEITTGGFLKGYAVDCLMEELERQGITDAIVNAGGSTIACLNDDIHPYWTVQVNDPVSRSPIGHIKLRNASCSTTSSFTRQVTCSGKAYGHIFDPFTGQPVQNNQCGILSRTSLAGDILSTGLFRLQDQQFLSAIEELAQKEPCDGYQITANNQMVTTRQFIRFLTPSLL